MTRPGWALPPRSVARRSTVPGITGSHDESECLRIADDYLLSEARTLMGSEKSASASSLRKRVPCRALSTQCPSELSSIQSGVMLRRSRNALSPTRIRSQILSTRAASAGLSLTHLRIPGKRPPTASLRR